MNRISRHFCVCVLRYVRMYMKTSAYDRGKFSGHLLFPMANLLTCPLIMYT